MKVFHIMPYDKFAKDYIEKLEELFSIEEHVILLLGKPYENAFSINKKDSVFCSNEMSRWEIYSFVMKWVIRADRVILHGLFLTDNMQIFIRILQPFNRRKLVWMIWGDDLYGYHKRYEIGKQTVRRRIINHIRKNLIYHFDTITYIEGDYDTVKHWYGTKARYMYASYPYHFLECNKKEVEKPYLLIMVGHNGSEECRHIEAFKIISKLQCDYRIVCPISYGGKSEYINSVKEAGRAIFGNRVTFLEGYMPYNEYIDFLTDVDIAVFNNNRQQGLGNIAGLLWLGKTVYINQDNNLLDFYRHRGVKLYQFDGNFWSDLKMLNEKEQEGNKMIIGKCFSDEAFYQNWKRVFEG